MDKVCVDCREVRYQVDQPGLYTCGLHQVNFPDAVDCSLYQPEPGSSAVSEPGPALVSAEFGTGIAFADSGQ